MACQCISLWSFSHFFLFSCSALYSRGADPCRLGFPGSRISWLLLALTNGRHCAERAGGRKAGQVRTFLPLVSLHSVTQVSKLHLLYGFSWSETEPLWFQHVPICLGPWLLVTLPFFFFFLSLWPNGYLLWLISELPQYLLFTSLVLPSPV